jgi:hypothetical protein
MEHCPRCSRPRRAGALECDRGHKLSSEAPSQDLRPDQLPEPQAPTPHPRLRRQGRQGRKPLRKILRHGATRIDELPEPQRSKARYWLSYLVEKRKRKGRPIRAWEWPVLQGVAKRLARSTADELSALGRRMRATLGGYAVQRRYRQEGRNPTAIATHMSKYIRRYRKRKREEAEKRARLGLPEPSRHGFMQGCDPAWD